MKLTPQFIRKFRQTLLEFFARFVMNTFKLTVGLALGVAVTTTRQTLNPSALTSTPTIMLAVVVLAFFISLVETWQDWEVIPERTQPNEDEVPAA